MLTKKNLNRELRREKPPQYKCILRISVVPPIFCASSQWRFELRPLVDIEIPACPQSILMAAHSHHEIHVGHVPQILVHMATTVLIEGPSCCLACSLSMSAETCPGPPHPSAQDFKLSTSFSCISRIGSLGHSPWSRMGSQSARRASLELLTVTISNLRMV